MKDKDSVIVLDTPNVLLYHKHRGQNQILNNLLALVAFLLNPGKMTPITVVTPFMQKKFSEEIEFMLRIIDSNGGKFFMTRHHDPDLDIITTAINSHGYILSNDKYRDYPDFSDYVEKMRIPFEIRKGKIILEAL